MNTEDTRKIQIAAMNSFKAALAALKANEIAPGASIMPRSIWAQGIVAAMFEAKLLQPESLESAFAILDSELGNSSQLGASLLKDGTIKRLGAVETANSYLASLAARG
jgi:hypothetical protein